MVVTQVGVRRHFCQLFLKEWTPPHRDREVRTVAAIHDGNALMSHLVRGEDIPRFSGNGGDFDDFQWKLERYFLTVKTAHNQTLGDKVKLMILERALPESDKRWLILLEKQGDLVNYQTVMARIAARAGPTRETQARQRWTNLQFKTAGKITVQELCKFEIGYREARQGLPELSEKESCRQLLANLPGHLSQ